MEDNAVALTALGVLATSVGLMAWVVKKVLSDVAPALTKHADTASELSDSVLENTKSNKEMLKFMKKLNGRLENAVIQKVAEQTVHHQHIEHKE
jgi:predicted nucleic acid-binding protein